MMWNEAHTQQQIKFKNIVTDCLNISYYFNCHNVTEMCGLVPANEKEKLKRKPPSSSVCFIIMNPKYLMTEEKMYKPSKNDTL